MSESNEPMTVGDYLSVIVLAVGVALVLFLIIAVPYYSGKGQVKEDWCVSEGGMYLEQTCYENGKELELK